MTLGNKADASAGVGQYSSTINKVKDHIPGTWEHEAKRPDARVRPFVVAGPEDAPSARMHAHAHSPAGSVLATTPAAAAGPGTAAHGTHGHTSAGTGESIKEKILKHIPGTDEFVRKNKTDESAEHAGTGPAV